MINSDDDVLELLERKRDEIKQQVARFEQRLACFEAAIAAFQNGHQQEEIVGVRSGSGVIPPIVDVCKFLKSCSQPVRQKDIIDTVGHIRHQRYPGSKLYQINVWKALEFHVRQDKLICCVDPVEGTIADLKPLPPRGTPRRFDQNNWFALKERMLDGRYVISNHQTQGEKAL